MKHGSRRPDTAPFKRWRERQLQIARANRHCATFMEAYNGENLVSLAAACRLDQVQAYNLLKLATARRLATRGHIELRGKPLMPHYVTRTGGEK